MSHSTLRILLAALSKTLVASACLLSTPSALAEVSASVSLVSRYLFRGVAQADDKPALQMGLDGHLAKGIYTGLWASRVETQEKGNVEVNGYLGLQHRVNEVTFDMGYLHYGYHHVDRNHDAKELFLKAHWERYSFHYYHDMDGPRSNYLQLTADYPLPYELGLHVAVGKQGFRSTAANEGYSHGLLMVSYPLLESLWTGFMWSDTWGSELGELGKAQGVLFLRVSLP